MFSEGETHTSIGKGETASLCLNSQAPSWLKANFSVHELEST